MLQEVQQWNVLIAAGTGTCGVYRCLKVCCNCEGNSAQNMLMCLVDMSLEISFVFSSCF